jgi:hypothetical protein
MSIVTIKEVKGVVTCGKDGKAEHVFNVKNNTDKTLKIGMQLAMSEPVNEEWLKIEEPTERVLDVEQITQITVKVQVPPDCEPGKYSYRLRVFDPDQPGEVYTDGDPVYFEVPEEEKEIVTDDKGKKIKWWIPAAILAAVFIIGVVIWQVLPKKVELPDFTQQEWTHASAEAFLTTNGLSYTFELQKDPNPGSGQEILSQTPDPGTKLKKGESVALTIAGVSVPSLKDLSFLVALQRISSHTLSFDADHDLQTRRVIQANEHEKVIDQDPQQGQLVAKKSHVKLTVGRLVNVRFDFKDVSKLKKMEGIKISPDFMTREVQPLSE